MEILYEVKIFLKKGITKNTDWERIYMKLREK